MSDTPQVLLAHHLKALKLPTFLREHEKLARQCAAEGVDHLRYLLRLAELELIEREQRTVEREEAGRESERVRRLVADGAVAPQQKDIAESRYQAAVQAEEKAHQEFETTAKNLREEAEDAEADTRTR